MEVREKVKEADKDLTLKTKYKLPSSDSPPPPASPSTREGEPPVPDYLPFGPISQKTGCHGSGEDETPFKSIDSGMNTSI